ncbi:extracellular solute-binding protein [Microbacterium resistens]|uniref:extracellular solute-binding protein n=1 Tax=Microbacterium resistens TaxID=156977 RepID=UPI0009FF4DAE|nr:extracellular solute-binding protein [Microbacterium resistens]
MKQFTRYIAAFAAASATVAVLAGCAGGGSAAVADKAPSADELTGEISLWHHYSAREAEVIQSLVDDFQAEHPGVKVTVSDQQEDTKIAQVAATSSKVDVMITNVNNTLGTLCKSMVDLQPYMDRDGVSADDFQDVFAGLTEYEGTRCSLPTTSDVFGLYYNTEMLAAAGFSEPPRTLQELEEMALALTEYNADGSIKTLGFNPLIGFGQLRPTTLGQAAGGAWMEDGKSALHTDPAWTDLINWQKAFVDEIGYDKLKTFSAATGDQFSADNPFQTGKIAMAVDGEWRVAFIEDQAKDLPYATAPMPVLDGSGQEYGGGYASGANIGISSKSKNQEAAWALVKYLSSDTDAAVKYANGFKNIPTLKAAADSADLEVPETYRTFVEASAHPATASSPVTAIGATLTQGVDSFWTGYQSGAASEKGLAEGLSQVDRDIDNALSLRGAK